MGVYLQLGKGTMRNEFIHIGHIADSRPTLYCKIIMDNLIVGRLQLYNKYLNCGL